MSEGGIMKIMQIFTGFESWRMRRVGIWYSDWYGFLIKRELKRKYWYYSDDNLMRAIWNGSNINSHRVVDCKFFAVKFSQIVETLLLGIVI